MDFNADRPPNRLDTRDNGRLQAVRAQCERYNVHLGLHTPSGVNVAEFSPYVSEAVDAYLQANIDLAQRLGCTWIIVHAGYHFSSHIEARMAAALEHLQRMLHMAVGPPASMAGRASRTQYPDAALSHQARWSC